MYCGIIGQLVTYTLLVSALAVQTLKASGGEQLDYYLPADIEYDASIPSPEEFFGFPSGEWHLRHDQLIAYMEELDARSNRISLREYGRTYEHRKLLLLTITAPENHSRLDRIQSEHQKLTEPSQSATIDIKNLPAVVYLAYSVHGNESSGSNAAPLIAYYLAAAQGSEVERQLRETVILLDPCLNPDGLNRFAHWANTHKGKHPVTDKYNREHNEVWPGGRTNHYWFDLNRDWLLVQHPESQGRITVFHEWYPNVLVDFHEMGTNSTYFFQPGIPSRNNPHTPQATFDLTHKIAAYHARALDKIGSLYYTEESFDDFYYGKGSTYPDAQGCIGILFEQASSRGHIQESIHGNISFPFTIRNQVATSFSTLRAALELRSELLEHKRTFFRKALQQGRSSAIKGYIFGDDSDNARTLHLVELLTRHSIDVFELQRDITMNGTVFRAGKAYIVPTAQRQYHLIQSIFEQRTEFSDSLFYDVSTWNMPLAFNLPYSEMRTLAPDQTAENRQVQQPVLKPGNFVSSENTYAYVFEWSGYYAPRAAYRLLQEGVKIKVAAKPFSIDGLTGRKKFGYGTIVVPLGLQQNRAERISQIINEITQSDGIDVYSFASGLTPDGIDLGSPSLKPVAEPRILLLTGDGVSSYEAGEAWHLLDYRMDIPVTLRDIGKLGSVNLNRYTTIIMVNGFYNSVTDRIINKLKEWIEEGGTLIAIKRAARWAAKNNLSSAVFKNNGNSNDDSAVKVERRPYVQADNDWGARQIGGSIFAADIDLTHPLCYGYSKPKLSVFRNSTLILKPVKNPYATPLQYTDTPLLSGYVSENNIRRIENSAGAVITHLGGGRVISLVDNPNFRAFWYGTNKIFLNAILFGNLID